MPSYRLGNLLHTPSGVRAASPTPAHGLLSPVPVNGRLPPFPPGPWPTLPVAAGHPQVSHVRVLLQPPQHHVSAGVLLPVLWQTGQGMLRAVQRNTSDGEAAGDACACCQKPLTRMPTSFIPSCVITVTRCARRRRGVWTRLQI